MAKDKIIVWGDPLMDIKTGKTPDINVYGIFIDTSKDIVHITTQVGNKVTQTNITMELALDIGLINLNALNKLL